MNFLSCLLTKEFFINIIILVKGEINFILGVVMNLSELKVGQRAKVTKLNISNKEIKRHLLDMGLTRGVIVKVKKVAPMGDPIDIELRDYELCIRKKDLNEIEVEEIK